MKFEKNYFALFGAALMSSTMSWGTTEHSLNKICNIHNARVAQEMSVKKDLYKRFKAGELTGDIYTEEFFQEGFQDLRKDENIVPVFRENLNNMGYSDLNDLNILLNCNEKKLIAVHTHTLLVDGQEPQGVSKEYDVKFAFDEEAEKVQIIVPGYLGDMKFDIQVVGKHAVLFTKKYNGKDGTHYELFDSRKEADEAAEKFERKLQASGEKGRALVLAEKKQPVTRGGNALHALGSRTVTINGEVKTEDLYQGYLHDDRMTGWETGIFFSEKVSRGGSHYRMVGEPEGVLEQLDYTEVLSALSDASNDK